MRIQGDWLTHPGTVATCAALLGGGHQVLFVGGCVRNALIGAPVSDIDIATDARPERVVELATAAGLKPIPTGIAHGTITVVAAGRPHEVTTFRRDVATDGRHATVAFADRLHDDAARRDFTMNALYARPDGEVVDPLDGLPDLLARRVRFVGEAAARIAEDYLRILRFFRFHAWYGDQAAGPDPLALVAIGRLREGLTRVSAERVGHEMRRLLAAPDPVQAMMAMQAARVLALVLPGADAARLGPLVALEGPDRPPDWLRRVAVLGPTDPVRDWRLSRAEARELKLIRQARELPLPAAAWRLGISAATAATLINAAVTNTPLPPGWESTIARAAAAHFPIAATDLMPARQGMELGAALHLLEERWIASGFTLGRDELLATLKPPG